MKKKDSNQESKQIQSYKMEDEYNVEMEDENNVETAHDALV